MPQSMLEGYETPGAFGKDMLRLLVRDAHAVYAYWEISNRKKWLASQHFGCDYGQLSKVLRLYDITYIRFDGRNANRTTDIELTPEADNWYITGLNGDAAYAVDFGVYSWERQFIPFIRSNVVQTPRAGSTDRDASSADIVPVASADGQAVYLPRAGLEHFGSG
ncbi:DUF4912 domain-containing protein [Paenibacillus hodogayensis]|uniref:DUF4912 domain-containing protein n=1 Tax=Paenibacillus hodogayensis TaxID=279208 RepID=A0ABV5VRG1_9BACL